MDPNRRDGMRQSFIATVKRMDPIDALVFKAIHDNGPAPWQTVANVAIASKLKCSTDDIMVSIEHLAELGCVFLNIDQPHLKSFGNLLMNAVSD